MYVAIASPRMRFEDPRRFLLCRLEPDRHAAIPIYEYAVREGGEMLHARLELIFYCFGKPVIESH